MPMYDRLCMDCGEKFLDCLEPMTKPEIFCSVCGGKTDRAWIGKANNIVQDTIEGGVLIRHGLCNPDGSPRRYYSKSEIAKEAAKRGLVNYVTHVGDQGSDKSKHTTRWV